MTPENFPEANMKLAKDQDEFITLDVVKQGDAVVSQWKLSPLEIEEVKRTGVIYVSQLSFGTPSQALYVTAIKAEVINNNGSIKNG